MLIRLSLQYPHTDPEDPTVHCEDSHMTLQEVRQANEMALGEFIGSLKAAQLRAEMEGMNRAMRKPRPLTHLWGMMRRLEKSKDFQAAYKKSFKMKNYVVCFGLQPIVEAAQASLLPRPCHVQISDTPSSCRTPVKSTAYACTYRGCHSCP